MGVTGSSIPVTRPLSSLRDRLILGATVGAAALAAVALYGSSGVPTSASGAAPGTSANPLPTVATVVPPPAAPMASNAAATSPSGLITPTASSGEHRSVEVLPAAKPAAEAPSPASLPPPHAAAPPRAAKGPRPRLAKQPGSINPYDDMQPVPAPAAGPAPATAEPLDRCVDERR